MLLRRITQHIKNQNWFAIFIDFLIVVIGVFIGIQVSNWNEHLNEKQRAENYRNRLYQDMTINQSALTNRQESFAKQIEYGLYALESLDEPITQEDAWKIVRAYFQASHVFTISVKRGTYDEIINSGDLALLNNQDLVNALGDFYSFSGFSTIETIPEYRENIRRIIPFQLQRYFHLNCYKVSSSDTHHLLDCPPPDEVSDLTVLATELKSNNNIKLDLRYMISNAGVSIDIAKDLKKKISKMLTMISNDTSSDR
ncbi:MAG TPA: DUF6090 family protein [Gammaproteobacteria bacterium]|nr:DUF6090 family protein [Gammaproteobacteria bacterium]HPQ88002.1 DUF6090 family protein [Gammaproteobacteria bacterium]